MTLDIAYARAVCECVWYDMLLTHFSLDFLFNGSWCVLYSFFHTLHCYSISRFSTSFICGTEFLPPSLLVCFIMHKLLPVDITAITHFCVVVFIFFNTRAIHFFFSLTCLFAAAAAVLHFA